MAADEHLHFPDQQSLLEVVLGIRSLAEETGSDLSDLLPHEEIQSELAAPVSLLIIGAVNSGKSSLLNALFRAPLAKVSKLPETSAITIHHSLAQPPSLASLPHTTSVHHHHPPALREFAVIDTPDPNRLKDPERQVIQTLLGRCNMILAVLPSSDPWAPAAWDLIAATPPGRLQHLVLVLQHADLRPADDIRVMIGHLSVLAQKRCGMTPPILPLSIPHQPATEAAWKSSGCADVWNHLIQNIQKDPHRKDTKTKWLERSHAALERIDQTIDGFDSEIGRKSRYHAQCQAHLDEIRAHFLGQLDNGIEELKRTLQTEGRLVSHALRKKLAILPSVIRLFGKDHTAIEIEHEYRHQLAAAIKDIGIEDADAVSQACLEHWHSTVAGAETHGIALKEQNAGQVMEDAAEQFIRSLEKSVSERLECIHLRNRLVRDLRSRNRALGAFTASTLLFLLLAGVFGAMQIPWLPYLLCLLAFLFIIGAVGVGIKTKKPVIDSFLNHQSEACSTFAKSLHTGYESALIGMFQSYNHLLIPLHREITHHESRVKPLQKRWQELFLLLKSIE